MTTTRQYKNSSSNTITPLSLKCGQSPNQTSQAPRHTNVLLCLLGVITRSGSLRGTVLASRHRANPLQTSAPRLLKCHTSTLKVKFSYVFVQTSELQSEIRRICNEYVCWIRIEKLFYVTEVCSLNYKPKTLLIYWEVRLACRPLSKNILSIFWKLFERQE